MRFDGEGATAGDRTRVWRRAAGTLADMLRLLHPIMPFITEAIWESLHATGGVVTGDDQLLMTAHWPEPGARNPDAEAEFSALAELIRSIRNARLESGLAAGQQVPLELLAEGSEDGDRAERARRYVEALARVQPFTIHATGSMTPPADGAMATPQEMVSAWPCNS